MRMLGRQVKAQMSRKQLKVKGGLPRMTTRHVKPWRGEERAGSHFRFVLPLIHFIIESLT
jgi:hypothetical protein